MKREEGREKKDSEGGGREVKRVGGWEGGKEGDEGMMKGGIQERDKPKMYCVKVNSIDLQYVCLNKKGDSNELSTTHAYS